MRRVGGAQLVECIGRVEGLVLLLNVGMEQMGALCGESRVIILAEDRSNMSLGNTKKF